MFEQIFQRSELIALHRHAPLGFEREQYLKHLLEQGYCHSSLQSAATYMLHAVRILGLEEFRVVHEAELRHGAEVWAEYRGRTAIRVAATMGRHAPF
ncbi:MAG: hypothetical protein HIU93_11690 [Acidobacteria bacterium]|nr:hypothetical protein [Acidobacteriota bacterium]